jgi:hypothetical protein
LFADELWVGGGVFGNRSHLGGFQGGVYEVSGQEQLQEGVRALRRIDLYMTYVTNITNI